MTENTDRTEDCCPSLPCHQFITVLVGLATRMPLFKSHPNRFGGAHQVPVVQAHVHLAGSNPGAAVVASGQIGLQIGDADRFFLLSDGDGRSTAGQGAVVAAIACSEVHDSRHFHGPGFLLICCRYYLMDGLLREKDACQISLVTPFSLACLHSVPCLLHAIISLSKGNETLSNSSLRRGGDEDETEEIQGSLRGDHCRRT